MKEVVPSSSTEMIENVELSSYKQPLVNLAGKVLCHGCNSLVSGTAPVNCNEQSQTNHNDLAKLKTVEANLKDEKEKNAQLEALILAMTSKLEMFHSLASSFLDMEAAKNDTTKAANLQELYRQTANTIEAYQVATDVEEATELEGRQAANHLEKEQSKKRKWRRTGMKNLSSDFRDVF